jgi:HD-GYP domain-containing protein (c-di-GMP phosphodiesterase class II)
LLRFGMYISELDRPWTDTPFVFQGFLLKTDAQLNALRKYCKHVFVDLEKSDAGAAENLPPAGAAAPRTASAVRGKTVYKESASVEKEFDRARDVYTRSATLFDDIFRVAATGEVLDGGNLKQAVSQITESVVRNPDALLLVSKLREKSDAAAARALDVSIYMTVFGRFLQQPREDLDLLGLLGLLQDVGKVKLPKEILDKKEELTVEEFALARQHVEFSRQIIAATPGLPTRLPDLAMLHHERFNGSGYPRGLKGPQIGLHGSIAGLVDEFDALTRPRPYAEPMSPSNALNFLYRERGTSFDPALVEQFIQCIGIFPVGSVVELNTGEVGIVITQNLMRRLKPRVMVVLDEKGRPMRPNKMLDLAKDPKAAADEPYRIRRTLEHGKVEVNPKEFFL